MLYLCGRFCKNMKQVTNSKTTSIIVLCVSLIIVVLSVVFTTSLTRKLASEEKRKMEIWAEATRQFILADENTDIDFVTSIIEGNNTIPVYMVDKDGNLIISRNAKAQMPPIDELNGPIVVEISDEVTQYIYYDESTLLYQLHYIPYIQFALIFLFIVIGIYVIYVSQRSEQNRVWAGLSKETAHQLGTPISSLNAWLELLQSEYKEEYIPQMRADIERLQVIADRFSKIGSNPALTATDGTQVISRTIDYMQARTSSQVTYTLKTQGPVMMRLNAPLFAWVIENLIKNAIDAMNGAGTITITVSTKGKAAIIDVTDTGKGIEHRRWKRIFQPGYSTKQRGWGLGLCLSKRIVEDYHCGKLFVKDSQINGGTTFRIILEQAVNS